MEPLSCYGLESHTDSQVEGLLPEMTKKSFLSLPSYEKLASPVLVKRPRITNSIPTCQVLGCNKDLGCSKEYHKRHRVCDVHSKTARVIVNGIEQRFCQQCSRFHRLTEFDEGKRSCRKRLAGHNQRRRKPQFDTYLDSTYFTTDASKTSLLFSSILPDGLYDSKYNKPFNCSRYPKLEQDPSQISQYAANTESGQTLSNSAHSMMSPPSKRGLNNPLSVQESSVGSNSSCALSLLSAQSHNLLLSNSPGTSTSHPLIPKENYHSNLLVDPYLRENISGKFTPIIPTSFGLPLVPEESEISPNFNALNPKSCLSRECSETVSLLELSLHLQRVEQQKYSSEVKLENHVLSKSNYS